MKAKKIHVVAPKLREVVDELMRRNKWSQTQLGERLGMNQSMVSKMRYGPDWQQHWEAFLAIMEMCEDQGIFKEYYLRLKGEIRRRLTPYAKQQFDDLLSKVDPGDDPPRSESADKSRPNLRRVES